MGDGGRGQGEEGTSMKSKSASMLSGRAGSMGMPRDRPCVTRPCTAGAESRAEMSEKEEGPSAAFGVPRIGGGQRTNHQSPDREVSAFVSGIRRLACIQSGRGVVQQPVGKYQFLVTIQT